MVPITQNKRPVLPPPPAQDLDVSLQGDSLGKTPAQDRDSNHGGMGRFGATPLAAAFRFVEPTWRNYIMYVDMEAREGNADAKRYLSIWQSLPPKERNSHMPEQLCELATVPASDLIAWVSRQVWQEGSAKASMCMSFMRDRVLERYATYALESPDNYKHGELFMKASGLLPQQSASRGALTIPIFNMPSASSGSVALAGAKSETMPGSQSGLRGMDEEIVELARVMQTGDAPKYGDPDPDDDDDEGDDDEEDD